jgi:hypothetical protein
MNLLACEWRPVGTEAHFLDAFPDSIENGYPLRGRQRENRLNGLDEPAGFL